MSKVQIEHESAITFLMTFTEIMKTTEGAQHYHAAAAAVDLAKQVSPEWVSCVASFDRREEIMHSETAKKIEDLISRMEGQLNCLAAATPGNRPEAVEVVKCIQGIADSLTAWTN